MASLTLLIVAAAMAASTKTNTQCHADSYLRLAAAFPNAVKYVPRTSTIDFCPDNTCQRFTSHSKASCEVMSDFLFVFLRYFSAYQTLKHWPHRSRCAMERAIRKHRITAYDVTYDEGERILTPFSLKDLTRTQE